MQRAAAPNVAGRGRRPPMANEIMRQETNQTFHQWANVYPATTIEVLRPITKGPDRGTNAVTNALTLQEFEDLLSQYFGKQHKIKDADKIFPRQSRIDHIIAEKQNEGTTNKPASYDNSPTNAGWKFYVKKYFQCSNQNLRMDSGLLQLANHLYTPMPDPEQSFVEDMWNQYMPSAEHRQAPITSVEQSYIHYIQAHIHISTDKNGNDIYSHRGRDETFDFLKFGISSSFPKALISELNANCPSCKKKFNDHRKVGLKRERERNSHGIRRVARKRRFEKFREGQQTQPGVRIGEKYTPPQQAPAPASVPAPFQQNMGFWLNDVDQLPNNAIFDPNLQMNAPAADYHQIDDPFNNDNWQFDDPFLSGIYASREYDEAFAPQQNNFQAGQEDVDYYEINASGPPVDQQLHDSLMDGGALQGQGFNLQQNDDEDVLMNALVGYNQQHDFPVGYHPQQNNVQDVPDSQKNNLLDNFMNMQPNSQPHLGARWQWIGIPGLEWILLFPFECIYSATMWSEPIWKDLSSKITFGIEEKRIPAEVRNIVTEPGVPHVGGPDQANIQPNTYPEPNPFEPHLPEQLIPIDPQLSEQPEQDNPLGHGPSNIGDLFDEPDKEPTPGPWAWNGGCKPQGARIGVLTLPTNPQGANSG
jgi:hypothetical protein